MEAGVLIVGSLDWDEAPPRPSWRESRLDHAKQFLVSAPIRYGRKSRKRNNTYTMIFSRSCPLGQAKVVRFRSRISKPEDLILEARHLWTAEDNAQHPDRVSGSWGCVCLLVRPGADVPADIIEAWSNHVSREDGYGGIQQLEGEGALVENGILNISWPVSTDSGKSVPIDLLLATATNPNGDEMPRAYPNARTIAMAWERDGNDHVNYFWKNRDRGIRTFQDDEIITYLSARR
jgi:hypothetical protein